MTTCGIYKITNLVNEKVYIGQAQDIEKRWREHKCSSKSNNQILYRAIRKYGLENFSFEILEECKAEQLNEKENYWIKYFNSQNEGYNETLTEYNLVSQKMTSEILENIIQDLNEKYFKIKECLTRCGNIVLECNKDETKNILFSFFNLKKFLDN